MKLNKKMGIISVILFSFFGCSNQVKAFTEEQQNQISVFQVQYQNLDQNKYNYKNVFDQTPVFATTPFLGSNSKKYLESYSQTYNFVRSLFNLPSLPQNSFDNQASFAGAYDMASVPKNDGSNVQHGLQGLRKPEYISNENWKLGINSTREGNIANIIPTNFSNYAQETTWDNIISFVADNNNYDDFSVGHRDWMLSQTIRRYGIGTVYTNPADLNTSVSNGINNYALGYQVFYWGGGYDGNYGSNLVDPLTYPAKNIFPIELMNSSNPLKPVYWSIGFNQARTKYPSNKPTITIKSLSTGKTTVVDPNDIHYESQYGGYNTSYTFIPRGLELKVDQPYEILFENLKLNSGMDKYSYQVSFFNLKQNKSDDYDYSNAGKIVYVNYQPSYGVRVYQNPGSDPTNIYVFHGTNWEIIKQTHDQSGQIWTQLSNNQWIPNKYLVTENNGRIPVGTVHYVKGYGVNLWNGYGNEKEFSGRRILDGSQWKVYKKAIVGNTYWFNLGADFWVDGQYMNIES